MDLAVEFSNHVFGMDFKQKIQCVSDEQNCYLFVLVGNSANPVW